MGPARQPRSLLPALSAAAALLAGIWQAKDAWGWLLGRLWMGAGWMDWKWCVELYRLVESLAGRCAAGETLTGELEAVEAAEDE